MVCKDFVIRIPGGVQIKTANKVADIAEKSRSKSLIIIKHNTVNLRSLLNILAVGINEGDKVTVTCEGEDETETMEAILSVLDVY